MHALLTAGWIVWAMLALDVAALGAAIVHAARAERWSLRWAIGLLVATPVMGFVLTIVGLTNSFAAVDTVDPSMKATMLAKGISCAMNATVLGLGVVPLWVGPFVIGEVRRGRRRRNAIERSAAR
jgi:MotA/TolQ/ExbB proton channel family